MTLTRDVMADVAIVFENRAELSRSIAQAIRHSETVVPVGIRESRRLPGRAGNQACTVINELN